VTRQFGRRSGKASEIGAGPAAVVNMEAHANSAEVDILRAAASKHRSRAMTRVAQRLKTVRFGWRCPRGAS